MDKKIGEIYYYDSHYDRVVGKRVREEYLKYYEEKVGIENQFRFICILNFFISRKYFKTKW